MIGAGPTARDFDETWTTSKEKHGIVYVAASEQTRGLIELGRPILLEGTQDRTALVLELSEDGPLRWLGDVLAMERALGPPRQALAHRDAQLAYHRDQRAPYPCVNATVFLRRGVLGGLLVFPDARVALACEDGYTAIFDGQRVHGMTALHSMSEMAYRVSVTYYCPTEEMP